MTHFGFPALALVIAGLLPGCASAPKTPEQLETGAKQRVEQAHQRTESRSKLRATTLWTLSKRWENYRISTHFRKEKLILLQALCERAQRDWGSELKRLLLSEIKDFADRDILSFYRMERIFGLRDRLAVADVTLLIGSDLRRLVRHRALTAKEYQIAWGQAEQLAAMDREYLTRRTWP